MKYSIGDIFICASATHKTTPPFNTYKNDSKAVITIVDYVYREYCKKYRYVLEHNYSSSVNSHVTTYDVDEDHFRLDNAMKHYTHYPVVK
jgi:hypothetical protein